MFCPNCATPAADGQRYCRICGANLGAILDAFENKRGSLDFESLKNDLRDLGASLRAGLEEAKHGFNQGIKRTQRFQGAPATGEPPKTQTKVQPLNPEPEKPPVPIPVTLKNVRGGSTRKHSLAQATLSIFGGGATAAVLFYILRTADESGFLSNFESTILAENPRFSRLTGMVPIIKALWVIGLLPVAKGVAHLLNGIFFAAKPLPEAKEVMLTVPYSVKVKAVSAPRTPSSTVAAEARAAAAGATDLAVPDHDTNELLEEHPNEPPPSVTEEETIRLSEKTRTESL